MGGDGRNPWQRVAVDVFQSTPPHGGRLLPCSQLFPNFQFQSTPPHGGRPGGSGLATLHRMFQSTPPHGGRRNEPRRHGAPHKGFNPRPHMGGDSNDCICLAADCVSIHAPTWGATSLPATGSHRQDCFNPRPHMGGDGMALHHEASQDCFNPRPHMGGDCVIAPISIAFQSFNPRPHMGGDTGKVYVVEGQFVSIHAPTWGATEPSAHGRNYKSSFNPRPHMGGDLGKGRCPYPHICFNPRPHMGGDFIYIKI